MVVGTVTNIVALLVASMRKSAAVSKHQLRRLGGLVDDARRSVPMYRDLYKDLPSSFADDAPTEDRLLELPIVSKGLLKRSFPDLSLSQDFSDAPLYKVATSGTADRVMLFQDERKRDSDRAADFLQSCSNRESWPGRRRMVIPPDACYERCGLDERARIQTVADRIRDALAAKPGARRSAWRRVLTQFMSDCVWRIKYLKSLGVEGSALSVSDVERYFQEIANFRPAQLSGLPYYLYILAVKHHPSSNRPRVPILRPSGGKATEFMIEVIEQSFGGRYRENYGTAELGTVSGDCKYSRNQHLIDDFFKIEFVRNGNPVQPGEVGEIIVTDLKNRASPLIRYAVGDVGARHAAPCECGSSATRFEVKGRMDELIVLPDGTAFAGDDIINHFQSQPGLRFCKLIQKNDNEYRLDIAPDGSEESPPDDSALSDGFSAFLNHSVRVRLRRVKRIAPEGSGKYRLVSSSSFHRFHDSKQGGTSRDKHAA